MIMKWCSSYDSNDNVKMTTVFLMILNDIISLQGTETNDT